MNKEFLIPMYGYNLKFLEEASMFEKQHQVSISYFEKYEIFDLNGKEV